MDEIVRGLTSKQKCLPTKLFFDEIGSELFLRITEQPEYYVARVESALLSQYASEMIRALQFPKRIASAVVEFGASSEDKATCLLDAENASFSTYVAIDISPTVLQAIEQRMKVTHPNVTVMTIRADFLELLSVSEFVSDLSVLGFFPGNTIANFPPADVVTLLAKIREAFRRTHLAFIIGIDLCRDPVRLTAAYNDAAGIQAAFHRNLLVNVNRLTSGDLNDRAFRHSAMWNEVEGRMEFDLVSRCDQVAYVAGYRIHFYEGEKIRTGISHKFHSEEFTELVSAAGWKTGNVWKDPESLFGIFLMFG